MFHLSLNVVSVAESLAFFVDVLRARVTLQTANYTTVEWGGCQITLQREKLPPSPQGIHFGVNFSRADFEALAAHVQAVAPASVLSAPHVVDAGTPQERRKMYLQCPSGYMIELKGF